MIEFRLNILKFKKSVNFQKQAEIKGNKNYYQKKKGGWKEFFLSFIHSYLFFIGLLETNPFKNCQYNKIYLFSCKIHSFKLSES